MEGQGWKHAWGQRESVNQLINSESQHNFFRLEQNTYRLHHYLPKARILIAYAIRIRTCIGADAATIFCNNVIIKHSATAVGLITPRLR